MNLPRRDALKLLGATAAASVFGPSAAAFASRSAVEFSRPEAWDYPAVDALLPFGHGVKSGDPLPDRVIIWTRISIPDAAGWLSPAPQGLSSVPVSWLMARDRELQDVVAQGETSTNAAADWTVKVDVDGLESASTYWFAFACLGRTSIVGRTRTAPGPEDDPSEVRVVQTACSKWWAGYFSMYGRLADRNDVDVLLHAGDQIYHQQKANRGTIRLPPAALAEEDYQHIDVRDWARPEEVGRRYALYATDPDLLRAHAALPFVIMPDQHDTADREDRGLYGLGGVSNADAAEQFHLWNADRPVAADGSGRFDAAPRINLNLNPPRGEHARLFYKHLPYGQLLDIICIDMRRSREIDKSAPFLSPQQWSFLERVLSESAQRGVAWRVLLNGVSMTQMNLLDSPAVPDSVREEFFGEAANGVLAYAGWNDFPAERQRLYTLLRQLGLLENIVLSGDIHGQFVAELIEENEAPAYLRGTGLGSYGPPVGVEIMSGMSSGGADEVSATEAYQVAYGRPPGMDPEFQELWVPAGRAAAKLLEADILANTPNMVYAEWSDDAYALCHLRSAAAVCELWRVNKRDPHSGEDLMYQFSVDVGVMNIRPALVAEPSSGERRAQAYGQPQRAVDFSPLSGEATEPDDFRSGSGGRGGAVSLFSLILTCLALWMRRRS